MDCATAQEWEAWLEVHAGSSSGVWVRIVKKGSPKSGVTIAETGYAGSCFGCVGGLCAATERGPAP